MTDPQTAAFHRLLLQAHQGGQTKVDVLVALVQRTVRVVPWPGGIEGYRTLVNSEGTAALPLFTTHEQLEEAARRYGWLAADGSVPSEEVGARAALNYAVQQNLTYVVVDIAADHVLEIGREEFEPLLTAAARRDSSGPYAASGKISSSLIQAVRPTPPPGAVSPATRGPGSRPPIAPPASTPGLSPSSAEADEGFTVSKDFDPKAGATFGGGSSVTLSALSMLPEDSVFDALSAVLRGFPEVEWASLVNASRGPAEPVPTVGVRVDASFRQRVNEIVSELRGAASAQGTAIDVLLLDDASLVRGARAEGVVFYPWRKR